MHIKQVFVSGFRSYKDQLVVEPFSKEHNVVIGRNGTGKSNFFDAIRFGLLTSRFANLRTEDRQALLHEGSGKHVMSAFVEIVFDNSDGRLPVDTEEVVLRRTIGVKKDEFFLNRKHISKSDVIHLLESAGFSRSNPYYIVQQGKVNALAVMKEKERLELLREVAGTKVYEDRREESLKILQETQVKREKIEQVISYIEERLEELEGEKEELKQYQKLDRKVRALEYSMHHKELQVVKTDLDTMERKRTEDSTKSQSLHDKHLQLLGKIQDVEIRHSEQQEELNVMCKEHEQLESARKKLIEIFCQLELEMKELDEGIEQDKDWKKNAERELHSLHEELKTKKEILKTKVVPNFERAKQSYEDVKLRLQQSLQQSDELIAKESRKSQFRTKKERDMFLDSEIKELEQLLHRRKCDKDKIIGVTESLRDSVRELEQDLESRSQALHEHRLVVNSFQPQLLQLKEERNTISEERKELWRVENELASDVRRCADQLKRGENVLHSTMAFDVRRGLEAVREMTTQMKIKGVYGPLIDLVAPVDERFCTAVDEAAGGSLFHVVVDTDDIATKLMRELERKNLGRITFLPLNCLKVDEHIQYPESDDCIPLITKLKFSSDIRKAVLTAFGKKLLCKDLDICVRYAEVSNMDCLTLDGDLVHRRGALNGGYRDPHRSRTRAIMEVQRARSELEDIRLQEKKAQRDAQEADQRVAIIVGQIQKLESEKRHAMTVYEDMSKDIRRLRSQIESEKSNLVKKETLLQDHSELGQMEDKIAALKVEMGRPLHETLSTEEVDLLHSLSMRISELQLEERTEKMRMEEVHAEKQSIELELTQNLERRIDEIKAQLDEESVHELRVRSREGTFQNKKVDLIDASRQVESNNGTLKEVEQKLLTTQVKLTMEKDSIQSLRAELVAVEKELGKEGRQSEKLLNRRRTLMQKRDDLMRSIRELGTLPLKEVEKYKDVCLSQVIKTFGKCRTKLKNYNHVNKKALDQYVSFEDQRTTLIKRKEELDSGYGSIASLIEVLDRRKDEAILRTFKGVSHHFAQVFRELVPTGEGKMLIIRSDTSSESPENPEPIQEAKVDTFSGVQIKVSFRGEGDSYLMQQLSGGQKALVALAFIFAIQRCDPAPFYLLDEIDQALDSTHRAAVASLIHRQAHSEVSPAQFITSTFRPELVSVADRFYGIGYQNKISSVHSMTKEESLDFIANIMAEEEEVARDTKR
uniref:Structural maintenance of chromosomes protein n=1 Tax=Albugo laibachii Nc14 TaxID=890382 RepID=F0W7R5_9STRA|nr:structural maintenance of chromosomes protein 3 put [Albugo laibachii Nc14]|eukprot:CCA17167.1 structural maintenance of chromosomes protein 3 put [Albugo laibachii Nc14]